MKDYRTITGQVEEYRTGEQLKSLTSRYRERETRGLDVVLTVNVGSFLWR